MTKECNACGRTLPLDDDHWYWRINPKSGNRVTQGGRCRECTRTAQKAAPKAPRTDAQRERENAVRRDQRAAAGATPRPVPAMLRRPMARPVPAVKPYLDPAVMAEAAAHQLAMIIGKPATDE